MIYLDNAATTQHKPREVIDAVVEALSSMGNASRGTHDSSLKASRIVYNCRVKLAELFNCPSSDRVVFTMNSTEALNIAINGLIRSGDHVISTDLEHNSVLRPLYRLEAERQVTLSFVPADEKGLIKYEDFESLINERTRAIVCTHASNLTGNVVDIARIGAIARKHGILFIVDASQSAGCLPIDMKAMNIDVLCFTGHKGLMGPQGTGGLCVATGVDIAPFKVGGTGVQSYSRTQPKELPTLLEAGTLNSHGIAGLDAALDFIRKTGLKAIHDRETELMLRFYNGVRVIPDIKIYGDFSGSEHTAIVALNIGDFESGEIADELAVTYGIATRPGAHCAPRLHEALGTTNQGAVRFSFSWFTTEAEVDEAIRAVTELAGLE